MADRLASLAPNRQATTNNMPLLTEDHKSWIGTQENPVRIEISRRDICKYSAATDQQLDKYLDGDEAPPMFIFNLFSTIPKLADMRPDGLPRGRSNGPKLPLHRVMAGGTQITQFRAIKPGDVLTGIRTITDMFEKEGSTGPLIFTVRKLEIRDQQDRPVMTETQTSIAR